jgi:hypothetical protein
MDYEKTRQIVLVKSDIEATYGSRGQGRKRKLIDDDDDIASSCPAHSDSTSTPPSFSPQQSPSSSSPPSPPEAESDSNDSSGAIPSFPDLVAEIIADTNEDDNAEVEAPSTSATTLTEALRLSNLFQYPSATHPSPPSLRFLLEYWKKAEDGLEIEREFHETPSGSA